MTATSYRVYILGVTGRIVRAEVVSATDDESAITEARRFAKSSAVEIWCGPRMVARVEQDTAIARRNSVPES